MHCLAQAFATAAHQAIGHRRRYTGEPYIQHLANVASLVETHVGDPITTQAAWLHDILEDPQVEAYDLILFFGGIVPRIVLSVTGTKPTPGMSRAERKADDRIRAKLACPASQSIKLADMIDNIPSIAIHDPEFARVYLAEKEALLPCLSRGNPKLQEMAHETLRKYSASI